MAPRNSKVDALITEVPSFGQRGRCEDRKCNGGYFDVTLFLRGVSEPPPPPRRGARRWNAQLEDPPDFRTKGMVVSRSGYMARHPRGSYMVNPLLSMEVATPKIKSVM